MRRRRPWFLPKLVQISAAPRWNGGVPLFHRGFVLQEIRTPCDITGPAGHPVIVMRYAHWSSTGSVGASCIQRLPADGNRLPSTGSQRDVTGDNMARFRPDKTGEGGLPLCVWLHKP
jgi:hypothetical protein